MKPCQNSVGLYLERSWRSPCQKIPALRQCRITACRCRVMVERCPQKECQPITRTSSVWNTSFSIPLLEGKVKVYVERRIHASVSLTAASSAQGTPYGRLFKGGSFIVPLEKGDVPKGQGDIKTLSNGNTRDYPVRCCIFPRHPLTFPENLVESPGAEGNPT